MVYDHFEVTSKDILDSFSLPDAFALFFAKLGYNTKPANAHSDATKIQLHHDTDLLEKIRVCRQLVEHTDETFSHFYVYLYVLSYRQQNHHEKYFSRPVQEARRFFGWCLPMNAMKRLISCISIALHLSLLLDKSANQRLTDLLVERSSSQSRQSRSTYHYH